MSVKKLISTTTTAYAINGSALKAERIRRKMQQKELAKLAGISTTFLCDMEKNNRNCSESVLNTLVRALEKRLVAE